jgi:hypothetical protein
LSTLTLTDKQAQQREYVKDGKTITQYDLTEAESLALRIENIRRCKAYKARKDKRPVDVSVGTVLHMSKAKPLMAPVRSLLDQIP